MELPSTDAEQTRLDRNDGTATEAEIGQCKSGAGLGPRHPSPICANPTLACNT